MVSVMSLVVALAVAAPIPKGAAADAAVVEPTGPPPNPAFLKADRNGNVFVVVTRFVSVQELVNGQVLAKLVPVQEAIEIRSLKNAITTAAGEKIDPEEAYKRLRDGGYVAISSDGKAVSPGYLRMLNRDVLVIASPALALRPEPNVKK